MNAFKFEMNSRACLLSPWLSAPGLYLTHGYPNTGKTHLALGISCAVASGSKFLKWSAGTPGRVLFVDNELGKVNLRAILTDCKSSMDVEDKSLPIRFMSPVIPYGGSLDLSTRPGLETLEEDVVNNDIDLIVLNTVASLCHSKQGKLKAWCLRMCDQGKAVLVIRADYRGKRGTKTFRPDRKDLFDAIIQMPQCTFTRKREALMKNDRLVVLPLNEFLKLDFGKKPKRKIYQRCPRDGGPIFWDTYLHAECVEVEPERTRTH